MEEQCLSCPASLICVTSEILWHFKCGECGLNFVIAKGGKEGTIPIGKRDCEAIDMTIAERDGITASEIQRCRECWTNFGKEK